MKYSVTTFHCVTLYILYLFTCKRLLLPYIEIINIFTIMQSFHSDQPVRVAARNESILLYHIILLHN